MTDKILTNRQAIGVLDGLWSNPLFGETHRQAFEIGIKAIKALEQNPKWIPVSERLPEDCEIVIASVDHQYVYPEARYSKEDGWEWAYESGSDYWVKIRGDVDAWMSLPKPYKPQEGNDKCSKCGYYVNPDYTRCKECGEESKDKE